MRPRWRRFAGCARGLALAAIGAGAAAAAVPAVAGAAVYCVNAPSCPSSGIHEGGNLQQALNDAAATASEADTVWTLAITATDASGNRSAVRTLRLIVRE